MTDYKDIKKDGWSIVHSKNDFFFLEYDAGIIGKMGAVYVVNQEIYNTVKNSSITLEELIGKYDIFNNFKRLFDLGEKQTGFHIPNTDVRYGNGDLIVTNENGVYFIEYQCSGHGGGSRKFMIDKQVYDDARTGNFSTSALLKKYSLYHLDIPDNDVK